MARKPPPRRRSRPDEQAPASAGASSSRGKTKGIDEGELLEHVPGGLAAAFVNARMHDRALAIAGLGEPGEWDGEIPQLPEDIAAEDHDSLSNLLGAFASCMSTANWFAAKARIDRIFFDEVVEYLESVAILDSKESNEQKRKADAATNETVVQAKALAASAQSDMLRFQTMASNLKLKHATVSRVGGFVADETGAEEQEHPPLSSTRGRAAGDERSVGARRQRPRRR